MPKMISVALIIQVEIEPFVKIANAYAVEPVLLFAIFSVLVALDTDNSEPIPLVL